MTLPGPTASYLNDVYLEAGCVTLVPELLDREGVEKPLIVTDRTLVEKGFVEQLELEDPVVFDRIQTNPTEQSVRDGLEVYRENRCDGLLALGGGSPMDAAKGIGLLVSHPPPLEQYALVNNGNESITEPIPPLVAVPTTAGSGSEVGRAALITVRSGEKLGFIHPDLLPRIAVCDPELTATMPPRITAATGMDALSHCVETYCSSRDNPTADALALDGLARGYRALPRAVEEDRNLEARFEMMVCSLHGGMAFQNGLGAVHSLVHPMGSLTEKNLHHGALNAIFLPHVLRFNREACPDKMNVLAERIGLDDPNRLPEAFTERTRDLGLPVRLRDMGVEPTDLDPLVPMAVNDHCTPTNPQPLTEEDVRTLYQRAW